MLDTIMELEIWQCTTCKQRRTWGTAEGDLLPTDTKLHGAVLNCKFCGPAKHLYVSTREGKWQQVEGYGKKKVMREQELARRVA